MLNDIPGSIGAMFLDREGEAVSVASNTLPAHDAQVIGAYEGIFLSQLRRICEALDHGKPERFKLAAGGANLFAVDLKEGYYLVLVAAHDSPEGLAWQRLESTRDQLLQEI